MEAPSVLIAHYQKLSLGSKSPDHWLEIKSKKNGIIQFNRERARDREMCSKRPRMTEKKKNLERVKDRSAPFSVQSTCLSHTNPQDFLIGFLLKKKN